MKMPPALLALAAAAAPANGRRHTILRRAQGNSEDAGNPTANGGGELNVVTGSGVEEAEVPPETGSTLSVPTYTDEQCDAWLASAFAADGDDSNGLSEDEFYDFLASLDDPPYVAAYFAQFDSYEQLPWLFHVVHKSLACKCEDLGLGAECCEGEGAEVPFVGLQKGEGALPTRAGAEYRHDACNLIAVVFQKAIATPGPTNKPVAPPETGPESGIAFECVRGDGCDDTPSLEPESGWTSLGACGENTDVGPCPLAFDEEANYDKGDQATMRPEDVAAKKMRFVFPGSVVDYASFEYSVLLDEDSTNDPEYLDAAAVMANEDGNGVLKEVLQAFGTLSADVLGGMVTSEGKLRRRKLQLPAAGMDPVAVSDIPCPAGLKYAPADVPCLNFVLKIAPSGTMANDEALRASFEDAMNSAINADGKLYDIVYENDADTLVMGLGNPGNGQDYLLTVDAGRSIDQEEESTGLSAGAIAGIVLLVLLLPLALLALYVRHKKRLEAERLRQMEEMRKRNDLEADLQGVPPGGEAVEDPIPAAEPPMEAEPDDDDESSAVSEWSESVSDSEMTDGQVSYADNEAAAGATAGSALAAMGAAGAAAAMAPGKSGWSSDEGSDSGKAEVRAEVRKLVAETNAPRSADELLTVYDGKEEVLLSHLRTMKEKQDAGGGAAVVAPLMGPDRAPPSNIDEELLSKLETQKGGAGAGAALAAASTKTSEAKKAADIDEELQTIMKKKSQDGTPAAAALASSPPSSPGTATSNIDKELLSKMEEKKEKPAAAASGVNSGFLAFMSAQKDFEGSKKEDPKAKIRKEVEELVAVAKPGKSADQLLKAYNGREEELLRNLRKLKASKREIV